MDASGGLTSSSTGVDVLLTAAPAGRILARRGPVGVRSVGPPDAEQRLLWWAGELERRAPWRRHAPPFAPTPALPMAARV